MRNLDKIANTIQAESESNNPSVDFDNLSNELMSVKEKINAIYDILEQMKTPVTVVEEPEPEVEPEVEPEPEVLDPVEWEREDNKTWV